MLRHSLYEKWLRPAALLAALFTSSCHSTETGTPAAQVEKPVAARQSISTGARIEVFAASSLRGVFQALALSFVAKRPGVHIHLTFEASSRLAQQIRAGAPADVFASAAEVNIKPLAALRVFEAPQVFAHNHLVILVPAANHAHVSSIGDLARPGLRLALTAPSVPIGRYTRQVLFKIQETHRYQQQYGTDVLKNAVAAPDDYTMLQWVESGKVDAAIVYASDATLGGRTVHVVPIPDGLNIQVSYPIAVAAGAPQDGSARAFVQFILSKDGQQELKRWGFEGR